MDLQFFILFICRKIYQISVILFVVLIMFLLLGKVYAKPTDYQWSVFAYGGKWSDNSFLEIIPGNTEFEESYIWTMGISRTIIKLNNHLLIEGELNAARHSGHQDHFEFNGAFNLRWHIFPCDHYLNTSLAYGVGPSYATEKPPIEEDSNTDASRTLLFMMAELTFAPPKSNNSHWEVLIRIHHRSGVFGIVDSGGSSNFITAGIRYRF